MLNTHYNKYIFHYALGQLVAGKVIKTGLCSVHFHFHLCPAVIIMLCLHIKPPDGEVAELVKYLAGPRVKVSQKVRYAGSS